MPLDTLSILLDLGSLLDTRPAALEGETVRDLLISSLLKVRSRSGAIVALHPNRAQFDYSQRCGRRNIVLKARQMGITTYVAARFFISTITRPGTVSVQVAHDQRSAQELFRIVHRFQENLPEWMRREALVTSYSNVGQMVFLATRQRVPRRDCRRPASRSRPHHPEPARLGARALAA